MPATSASTARSWSRWSRSSGPSLRLIGGQALLDGLLAVSALALLWWWLVLRDLPLGADSASLAGLSYPVLDLVLLCTIATTPLVAARRGTLAGWLVAAGVAAGGIADGVYTHLVLTDRLRLGRPRRSRLADPGLPDLPGRRRSGPRDRARAELGPAALPLRLRTAVSMTASLLVILLVLVVEGARGEPSARAIVFVFVVTALLLVRGWLLLISTRPRVGPARSAHRRLRRAAPARPAPQARCRGAAVRRAVRTRPDARPTAP